MLRMKYAAVGIWVAAVAVAGLSPCAALPLGTGARYTLGEYREEQPFELHFTWSLAEPMNHLRVLGLPQGAALQDAAPEAPLVHLRADRERKALTLEFEQGRAPMQSGQRGRYSPGSLLAARQGSAPEWRAELLSSFERRQPGGKRHTIRRILLSAEQRGAHGSTVYLQLLEVDATLGSVDLLPCGGATPARYAALRPVQDYSSAAPSGLPEKYNGPPLRRDMLRLLYAMAALDSPSMAAQGAPEIAAFAWQLAARVPMPHSPWPHCWGGAAEDAREIARRLTPTLVFLQENDCFGCQALADFINSPLFARIFGESFTEPPAAPVQEEPILYETTTNTSPESDKH